jgi:cytosine/creatinine deaminase
MTILCNALLADGRLVDVTIAGERIAAVDPARPALPPGEPPPAAAVGVHVTAEVQDAHEVHDLAGKLLLPAAAEPHAHIDKAFTADRFPNRTGDLAGAIAASRADRPSWSRQDVEARAERAAQASVANGITAIRSHVDLGLDIGLRNIEAVAAVRDRLRGVVDIQIVTLGGLPITGVAGADHRALLRDALDLADAVGGAPYLEPDPRAAYELYVTLAGDRRLPVDLHTDETLDPSELSVREFAAVVAGTGYEGAAAASHCVSLGVQDAPTQAAAARELAEAGLSVITLPQTNLFLQARGQATSPGRGLTAIAVLRDAGVNVAGGADNLQDPFNTMGRADPMETAALLVMAGHLDAASAYELVSGAARRALALEPVRIAPGSIADLVALDATTVREAVATGPGTRSVWHRGRLVATSVRSVTVATPGAVLAEAPVADDR